MYWLSHDMVGSHFRQLLFDKVKVIAACVDIDILFGKNMCKAIKSLLKLSTTYAKEISKLLWKFVSAPRP